MWPIFLAVGCNQPAGQRPPTFAKGLLTARREQRNATRGAAAIETSNDLLNEILCRSMADLQMLMTDTPEGPYPYAGIPWYSTTFGRDGLITALQMLWCEPGRGARRVAPPRRPPGPQDTIRCPMPSPARSCTRCGPAKWRRCARCRSGSTTAASTPRRCSSCWPASMPSAPAIWRRSRRCGQPSRRRCAGSTGPAIPTATASSNIAAPPSRPRQPGLEGFL